MDKHLQAMVVISRIESLLIQLDEKIGQERNDIGQQDWPNIGSLGHVAEKLEEIADFWFGLE